VFSNKCKQKETLDIKWISESHKCAKGRAFFEGAEMQAFPSATDWQRVLEN